MQITYSCFKHRFALHNSYWMEKDPSSNNFTVCVQRFSEATFTFHNQDKLQVHEQTHAGQ